MDGVVRSRRFFSDSADDRKSEMRATTNHRCPQRRLRTEPPGFGFLGFFGFGFFGFLGFL